jgi:acyl-CoA synthetase (AMP-forming)/AMP-acid ligase II
LFLDAGKSIYSWPRLKECTEASFRLPSLPCLWWRLTDQVHRNIEDSSIVSSHFDLTSILSYLKHLELYLGAIQRWVSETSLNFGGQGKRPRDSNSLCILCPRYIIREFKVKYTLLESGLTFLDLGSTIPLKYSIGAATAAYSYLDARYKLSSDLRLISLVIGTQIRALIKEKRDVVNSFYTLEYWAQKAPSRIFLNYNGKTYTYREAYETTLRYGTWMKQRFNVQSEEVVAMDFMNSDIFIWIWFGLWAIGAKPAFINYNLTGKPLIHSVRSSSARVFLVEEEIFQTLDEDTKQALADPNFRDNGAALEMVSFTPPVMAEIEQTVGKREPNKARSGQLAKSMAILIYTSGTTGLPKPAIMSWSKCVVAAPAVAGVLGLKKDDVFYTCMPLYHSSAAVVGLCPVLAHGCTLALGRKFGRQTFWEEVRNSKATVIQYVGETCRYLMSLPPSPLDKKHNVRMAFGNGLRPDVWPHFKERFGIKEIAEFYGATEAPAALFNMSRNPFSEGAVGHGGLLRKIIQGGQTLVVEMNYEENTPIRDPKTGFCVPAKTGQPGELLFKLTEKEIDKQFQGYWKNEGASNKKVLRDVLVKGDAYFSSGDIMREDSEGRWYFCDRIGDTFRWKSENVSTAEVAEVVGQMREYIEEANVYGVQLPGFDGRAGCAAIVLSPEQQTMFNSNNRVDERLLKSLAAHSLKNLPRFAVPIFLRVLKDESASHRTGTNKQQKQVLREEGVDPSKIEAKGDLVFWLPPGEQQYIPFSSEDWAKVSSGKVML